MEHYENLGPAGEGTYGVVMKARHKDSGQLVAIKMFKESDEDEQVRKTALREVRILKQLRHDHIVNLFDVFRRKGKLYLVFEFVERTVLEDLEKSPDGMKEEEVKKVMWQLIQAIKFCHTHNVIHRDIKPENLLISKNDVLKLCDFGFARTLGNPGARYTDYVSTRWYRAPELLVGDRAYGRGVDIWAIGCLMAELLTGMPIFPGESDVDQLFHIMRCMGALPDKFRDLAETNPLFVGVKLPEAIELEPLEEKLSRVNPVALDMIRRCLVYEPSERATCEFLSNHEFFKGFIDWYGPILASAVEKDHQALENVPRRRRGRRERREKDKAKREERRERREKDRHRHTRSEQGAAGGGGGSSGNEMDGTDGLRSDTMGSLPVDTTSCTPRMPQVPLSHRGPLRDNVSEREPLTHRSRPMTMESNMTGGGGSIPALRREAEREVAEMEGRGGRDYRGDAAGEEYHYPREHGRPSISESVYREPLPPMHTTLSPMGGGEEGEPDSTMYRRTVRGGMGMPPVESSRDTRSRRGDRETLPVVHDPYANPPTLKPMRHTVSHSITPTFGSSGKAYGSHAQSYGSSTHGAGQSRHGQVTSLQSVSRHRGIASPSNHNNFRNHSRGRGDSKNSSLQSRPYFAGAGVKLL